MPSELAFPEICWGEGPGKAARPGVLVGMASEAALIPSGVPVVCAAAVPDRAEALSRQLLDQGAQCLISVGIAGGLDPALSPGDVVVGSGVFYDGSVIEADGVWKCRLLSALPFSRAGVIHGSDKVVMSVAGKARLFAESGAAVVDMESGRMARVAAERGVPFAVLRVVADSAFHSLPSAAMVPLDGQGRPRIGAVLGQLARRPWELPGLIRLGLDSRAAMNALGDALQVVGPSLGL